MVHYVEDADLKHGITLCGLKVRGSMGVIVTSPKNARYVNCPGCRKILDARSKRA